MDLGLKDRVALITGSSRGTGEGIAKVLAGEGAVVLVHGMAAGAADRVTEEIRQAGGRAHAIAGDIATDAGADQAAGEALAVTGRIDVLVNNYGGVERGRWFASEAKDWVRMYETNVLSAQRLIRLLVPGMLARGRGRVMLLGTIGAFRPGARNPHYYAAKAALPAMVASLARELEGSGITVNLVSPGLIRTREVEEGYRSKGARLGWGESWEAVEQGILAESPNLVGRIGRVEEVGHLVAFLASDLAGYINGANVCIDGGALAAGR